jgi:hypothetical protein
MVEKGLLSGGERGKYRTAKVTVLPYVGVMEAAGSPVHENHPGF